MPWEGMPAFIWLTDGVHHWMNSVVIHRSFWVLGREARNMCWNYDFQWYKRTLWEIIILLQDLSYQERAQTFLAEGEWSLVKGKVKWGAFSSIQSSALTVTAAVWMSQLEGNVKANCRRGESLNRRGADWTESSAPSFSRPGEGVGRSVCLGQRAYLLILPLASENHICFSD